ncbi:MAG: acyl-CoA thioesterase [Cyanobacteria bacterium]|nr:acyl-CoA thioesterase [Cyanobacteriota bacterium]
MAREPIEQSSGAIAADQADQAMPWFEHQVRVHPQQTDYAGVVWHGAYVGWLEEARLEALEAVGIPYGAIVAAGCDLPVVTLNLHYHMPLRLGEVAVVRSRPTETRGVRWRWQQRIESRDRQVQYLSAELTLTPVDRATGRVMRRPPAPVQDLLHRLQRFGETSA